MSIEDVSQVDELLKVIEDLSRTHVEIGILGDEEKYKDGNMTVLGVAIIHEYGINVTDKNGRKINIPERSFIRSSYESKKEKIFDLESELEKVINLQMSVDTFFNLVGEYCVGIIQRYLTEEVKSPPLAATTIKEKGSSNPLIDTGKLKESIDFRIVRVWSYGEVKTIKWNKQNKIQL